MQRKLQRTQRGRKVRVSLNHDELTLVSLWQMSEQPFLPFESRVEALEGLGAIVVDALKQLGTAKPKTKEECERNDKALDMMRRVREKRRGYHAILAEYRRERGAL